MILQYCMFFLELTRSETASACLGAGDVNRQPRALGIPDTNLHRSNTSVCKHNVIQYYMIVLAGCLPEAYDIDRGAHPAFSLGVGPDIKNG